LQLAPESALSDERQAGTGAVRRERVEGVQRNVRRLLLAHPSHPAHDLPVRWQTQLAPRHVPVQELDGRLPRVRNAVDHPLRNAHARELVRELPRYGDHRVEAPEGPTLDELVGAIPP